MKASEIPQALDQIWSTPERAHKMRSSLFNLIVITVKDQRVPYVKKIVHRALERFPSRGIFVLIDPENNAVDFLEANQPSRRAVLMFFLISSN